MSSQSIAYSAYLAHYNIIPTKIEQILFPSFNTVDRYYTLHIIFNAHRPDMKLNWVWACFKSL